MISDTVVPSRSRLVRSVSLVTCACALLCGACDGRSSSTGRDVIVSDASGDAGADSSMPRPQLYPELLPALAPGMFWDVAFRYSGSFSGIGFSDLRGVRLILGAPQTLDGLEAFPVEQQLLWQTEDGDEPWTFAFSHLAVDPTRLWGRLDGAWTVLLDSHGVWTGHAVFWPGGEAVHGLEPYAMDTVFVDDATTIGAYRFVDAANCVYYPELGETICDDGSSTQISAAEGQAFYKAGVGFYGHVQTNVVSGGSSQWQYAVIRHGVGAPPCGDDPLPVEVCSSATSACIADCADTACAFDCAHRVDEVVCRDCIEQRYASCAGDAVAAREVRCCYASLSEPFEYCPAVRGAGAAPACNSVSTVGACAGLGGTNPDACAGEYPQRCVRREVTTCIAADTACNTVVDCAGAGGLGEVGCDAANKAVDCAGQACLVALDPEASDFRCADGEDNDGDGFIDCGDFGCRANPLVSVCGTTEVTQRLCSDGLDNDGNGFADCEDYGCQVSPSVTVCGEENTPASCSDGQDNEGDGLVDCSDDSCFGSPFVDCD